MTVYVDDVGIVWQNRLWYHLTADTTEELHEFAEKIGLKRSWFQKGKQPWLDHYDVTSYMRIAAIDNGAKAISWRRAAEITFERARREKVIEEKVLDGEDRVQE